MRVRRTKLTRRVLVNGLSPTGRLRTRFPKFVPVRNLRTERPKSSWKVLQYNRKADRESSTFRPICATVYASLLDKHKAFEFLEKA